MSSYSHMTYKNVSPLTKEKNRHAKVLQKSLLEIFNRIEAVKEEHDKLDNNNKFLQKYIGDLMSTSKITSTGASGRKK
jgi:short coiled-coil protein